MKKEERLTRKADFAAVYSKGKAGANNLVVLRALPNGLQSNRYGFSVSRRVGKAVVRNRVRRLLREGVRLTPIKPGWDMVFIARNRAPTADYHRLKQALEDLLRRTRLLESNGT